MNHLLWYKILTANSLFKEEDKMISVSTFVHKQMKIIFFADYILKMDINNYTPFFIEFF